MSIGRRLCDEKWYDEEYEFEIEVIGFLRGDNTEHYCMNEGAKITRIL